MPASFTSTGLVEELAAEVDGSTVEIARSAHGSEVLIQGLVAPGDEMETDNSEDNHGDEQEASTRRWFIE